MYGYAAIVFSDPVYNAFMPALAKLMLLSSFVHGVCFCWRSNIPFAIGQVQDAGLIFLSKIASDIATRMEGESASSVVATSLVTIALCTASLGAVLILIGRARLAKFVSYLPMPVIGGYLAFIGYFCLEAGVSLASGEVISGLSSWTKLVSDDRTVILCTPALVSGAVLTYISRYCTHFAALPAAIIFLPACFYTILYFSGCSFDDARDYGWLGPMTKPADSLEIFQLYDFSAVNWSVIPFQFPVWAAMVVVVAFSSCLDVAAIEMDMGSALDTNAELMTVGSSNLVSGLCGGFTGSYIFSQTIFGFRSGCHLRSVAAVMLILEIIVFGLKVDPLAYVPLFFFAATLIFIAIDLMLEWLLEVRHTSMCFC
jgi:sulfate permease, SulP family